MITRRDGLRLCALVLLAPFGCGEHENGEEVPVSRKTVSVQDVPPDLMAAAKKALPGIEFNQAWQNFNKEKVLFSYEIKGKAANGKIREVRIGLDGAVLEME